MEWIKEPWPWYVGGPMIAVIMAVLLLMGKRFGVSSSFTALCSMAGAGKLADHFNFDWKLRKWNFVFIAGSIAGGFIAMKYLMNDHVVKISDATVSHLQGLGMTEAGQAFEPALFNWDNLLSLQGFIMIILGGFLVGFGTRWANGCTSGHAISGLSNLQLPSLIAVIGFFIGGLFTTWFLLPWILTL